MSLNIHESVPVDVCGIILYCEKFRASCVKVFTEQNTVSGDEIITGYGKKHIRVILNGRVCNAEKPLEFLSGMNDLMKRCVTFSTEYKNITLVNCQVQAFSVDDENNDFVSVSVTLIAEDAYTESEEDSA
ncbi:MAG: hypothetical protein K2J08_04345 [Ruminococcus sp.]|nr:hypothetical protein [Ruminococcus sp.]